jgi:hypothetical protein
MTEEDPRSAFVRLAEARTKKILKGLDLLGNLSNRSNYSYSDEDVKKIFKAIDQKSSSVSAKFKASTRSKSEDEFKL